MQYGNVYNAQVPVFLTRAAEKAIDDLPKAERLRVAEKLAELGEGKSGLDIERLRGSPDYRLRVGRYRVIFARKGDAITVLAVAHRKEVYR